MDSLISKIKQQEVIANQLDVDLFNRKELLSKVADYTNDFIEKLPTATSFKERADVTPRLKIDNNTKNMDEILQLFEEEVNEYGIKAASGGHVGYIPGGGIYTAALGDYLAAISNEYSGMFYASP